MTRHPYTMPGVLVLLMAVVLALIAITHMPPPIVAPGVRPIVVTRTAVAS